MATYRLIIEYDGSAFHGWQTQPDVPTVQDELEAAFETVLQQPCSVVGSGRTDAGVHARRQVAHVNLPDDAPSPFRLRASLNGITDEAVAIPHIEEVQEGFHARFDACRRRYHYYLSTRPLALERNARWYRFPPPDFNKMNAAAQDLILKCDFSSFCITQSDTEDRVCEIETAQWVEEAIDGFWRFEIVADRFLHGMVRAIVGTLMQIGHKQRSASDVPRIIEARDRREAGYAAPACGLVLEEVSYPPGTIHPKNESK